LANTSSIYRELTRRSQDYAANAALSRLFLEHVDQGQDKCQCLAGAGLRRGNQVFSGECRLDGLGLHGGWFGKAVLYQIALEKSGKGEFRKSVH